MLRDTFLGDTYRFLFLPFCSCQSSDEYADQLEDLLARKMESITALRTRVKNFKSKLTEEEMNVAKKAARVLGLTVAGVDMLQTSKGPLVLEVNASPGLEGIETTTGHDIAGKIINYIEKNYNSI